MWRILIILAAFLWIASPPSMGLAQDKPEAVVLSFRGSGGSTARVQALRGVRQHVSLRPRKEAEAIAKVFEASLKDAKGRRVVADELGIDYLIWGAVTGKGSKRRTEIRIAGADGKQISAYEAPPPGKSANNAMIRQAAKLAIKDAIAAVPPSERAPEPVQAPKPTPEPKKRAPSQETKPERGETLPVFVGLVGGGGRVRNIKVNIDDGTSAGGVRKYESNVFFAIAGQFQFRPATRSPNSKLRGLYLQLDGSLGIGLEASPIGTPDTLSITTYQVLGQFGYVAKLRKGQVGGTAGIGFDHFGIAPNPIMASSSYLYVRPAFIGRYDFIADLFYGRIDLGFRYPFGLGELEDAFGSSSSGLGFDASLMLGGTLDVGFTYAARVAWERYQLSFSGPTATAALEPAAADGTDGYDQTVSFQLLVGWSF